MRNLLYGAIFLGVLVACQREPGYKITGSVPGTPDGMKVYLYNWNTPVDSGVVKGGKFVLTGKVDVPVRYQLWVDLSPDKNMEYEKDMRGSDIFVDNTDIRDAFYRFFSFSDEFPSERGKRGSFDHWFSRA